jgi:hypothetical protein
MACIINTGYSIGCRDNIGGIEEVYIRSFSGATTYSYDVNGVITGSTSGATSTPYYRVTQRQETAEFIPGAGQHSIENGTNYWEQTVNLAFTKYQANVRNLVYQLALTEVEIIVKTQNGNYFLVGEQNGANLTASNANVGKAFGDMNGATVTFLAKEPKPSAEVSSTYFNTLTIITTAVV